MTAVISADGSDAFEDAIEAFARVRPRLIGVAFRMLGTVVDAEDIVQDVWLRWQSCDRKTVRDSDAFLMTAATRLCINALQSARVRREKCVGPILTEPVDTRADPAQGAERGEALQFATLLLLEKLPPAERAAYILREAFDYPHLLIAQTLVVSEVNARQLVARARRRLTSERRGSTTPAEHRRLLTAFTIAAQTGNMSALEQLFAGNH